MLRPLAYQASMHCLKVAIDGNELYVAGVSGRGVLVAGIDFVLERSELRLHVGGLWYPEPGVYENVTWANRELQTGSHVSVSLVEDAEVDLPTNRSGASRERDDTRRRDYRDSLKKKLELYDAGAVTEAQSGESAVPLAFEVLLNGQHKCVAGHPIASVLGCHITCSIRKLHEGGRYSDAELMTESRFEVQGLVVHGEFENEHLTWIESPLHSGDVVSVDITQASRFDEPSRREREDPEEEVRRAREYLGA